ncbi:MAG: hypothetical protein RJA70_2310 [Pseudomonadota bacterium]|jgi:hypothetical protein
METRLFGVLRCFWVLGMAPLAFSCGSDEQLPDEGKGRNDTPKDDVVDDTPKDDVAAAGGGGTVPPPIGGGGASNLPNNMDALVGMLCETDSDCAEGLTCLLESAFFLDEGTIPMGMCTARCEDDPELCPSLDVESSCLTEQTDPNDPASTVGYCVDLCIVGQNSGCNGVLDRYCQQLQDDGVGACWPRCFDEGSCGPNKVCDGSTGSCLDAERPGKQLGEVCKTADDCNGGICYLSDKNAGGICTEQCIFTPFRGACGDTGDAQTPPEFMCMPSVAVLLDQNAAFDFGDLGLCTPQCDVDGDCAGGFVCVEHTEQLATAIGRAGMCLQAIVFGEPPAEGGSGGMANGGAASGGSPSIGGAASGGSPSIGGAASGGSPSIGGTGGQ